MAKIKMSKIVKGLIADTIELNLSVNDDIELPTINKETQYCEFIGDCQINDIYNVIGGILQNDLLKDNHTFTDENIPDYIFIPPNNPENKITYLGKRVFQNMELLTDMYSSYLNTNYHNLFADRFGKIILEQNPYYLSDKTKGSSFSNTPILVEYIAHNYGLCAYGRLGIGVATKKFNKNYYPLPFEELEDGQLFNTFEGIFLFRDGVVASLYLTNLTEPNDEPILKKDFEGKSYVLTLNFRSYEHLYKNLYKYANAITEYNNIRIDYKRPGFYINDEKIPPAIGMSDAPLPFDYNIYSPFESGKGLIGYDYSYVVVYVNGEMLTNPLRTYNLEEYRNYQAWYFCAKMLNGYDEELRAFTLPDVFTEVVSHHRIDRSVDTRPMVSTTLIGDREIKENQKGYDETIEDAYHLFKEYEPERGDYFKNELYCALMLQYSYEDDDGYLRFKSNGDKLPSKAIKKIKEEVNGINTDKVRENIRDYIDGASEDFSFGAPPETIIPGIKPTTITKTTTKHSDTKFEIKFEYSEPVFITGDKADKLVFYGGAVAKITENSITFFNTYAHPPLLNFKETDEEFSYTTFMKIGYKVDISKNQLTTEIIADSVYGEGKKLAQTLSGDSPTLYLNGGFINIFNLFDKRRIEW